MNFLPGSIMTLIIMGAIFIIAARVTGIIIRLILALVLIIFLIYAATNYGPEIMQIAPAPIDIV